MGDPIKIATCTLCGNAVYKNPDGSLAHGGAYDGSHYFCSWTCQSEYGIRLAKNNAPNQEGASSGSTAASGAKAGAGSAAGAAMAGAGIGMAAAGAGAALAGVGAAAKGLGALTKGAGSLLGGLGKGAGVMADAMKSGLDGTKAEFGKTRSAEQEIIAINKMTFSSDPEEYKKEIWALFDKATSKPADPLRDTFIIKAAKKKLIHELDMCKLKNPEMFSQFAQLYEELNKKKKLFGLFG